MGDLGSSSAEGSKSHSASGAQLPSPQSRVFVGLSQAQTWHAIQKEAAEGRRVLPSAVSSYERRGQELAGVQFRLVFQT